VNALFALAGVDYIQWKAVSRTLLRSDFRAPTSHSGESYSLRSIGGLLMTTLTFGIFGLALVPIIVFNGDVRLTGTVTLSYLTFALATTLLTQHGATMLTASDHVILGSRPVSSRTILAIRLTNVMFHTALVTTFMALAPVLAFTLAHGRNPWRGLGAVMAIYGWSVAVTCVVVATYTAVVRWIGAARFRRVVAYLQLVTGIAAYGGLFLINRTFDRASLTEARLPDTPWLLLSPPTWFASYIEIGDGTASVQTWLRLLLSILLLVAVVALLRGKLALDYSLRVAEAADEAGSSAPIVSGGGRRSRLFARNEARAVALLTVAHFRHDLRVRMSIFGLVPLILMYMFMGIRSGNADPFLGPTAQRGPDLLALAALLFPALIVRNLESSATYNAAWIYTATPARHGALIIALKNVAVAYFLAPFAVLIAALFSWRFGHVLHGTVHAALLAAAGYAALQTAILLNPRLPFAHPPDKSGSGPLFAWMFFILIGGQLMVFALQRFVYPDWTRIGAVLAVLATLSMLLERALRWRVAQ
jgi:hypothetical protein